MSDLCFLTATALRELIRTRRASVTEVLQAHLAQIERVNPKVNAIVTLRTDEALAEARTADAALARGEEGGPLFGLPVAHKDLVPTRGLRTTWGSPIYKDHVPEHDGLIVERIKAGGAITVGKTNTPEFGAGSQTFMWMRACSDITVTGLPAISVPCGFTPEGLPVGVQIVGRHHDDWGVLQLAYAFEQATGFWKRHPALAIPPP